MAPFEELRYGWDGATLADPLRTGAERVEKLRFVAYTATRLAQWANRFIQQLAPERVTQRNLHGSDPRCKDGELDRTAPLARAVVPLAKGFTGRATRRARRGAQRKNLWRNGGGGLEAWHDGRFGRATRRADAQPIWKRPITFPSVSAIRA